jgi:AAA+ ATPase superfamily predicted ATPase
MEMGLVEREVPFGADLRGTKRTRYRISDPFLGFWFRFVEPNRSRLEARQLEAVERSIAADVRHHIAAVWEQLARQSVPLLRIEGETWGPASRWWGTGVDRKPLEVDLMAESAGGDRLLVGEVKWASPREVRRLEHDLTNKAARLPFVGGREVVPVLWLAAAPKDVQRSRVVTPPQVLDVLR